MSEVNSELQIATSFNKTINIQRHQLSQKDMLELIELKKDEKNKQT